ncbi:MAG TPA: phosphoribosylamine--glycine ligase [Gemmatimonadales bacterium]|nr:phosphoribosylamine--glycine ligase [Gemmatimonadales bacterium]
MLVVGSGGREHALGWSIRRDAPDAFLFYAPGNPGTAELGTNVPVAAHDVEGLVGLARERDIDLTVIGPEVPLALGLADRLQAAGRPAFGPTSAAARIESSKAFAKDLMRRAGVPTAASRTFRTLPAALAYVDRHAEPLVVKASGLAAGKGAVVCATRKEAAQAVRAMLEAHTLGDAGNEVVIEEFMEGEELSLFALTNGRDLTLLPAAQDHKRLEEGDRGPNTGGMGAYSPVSLGTPALLARVTAEVLEPTLSSMAAEGSRFAGLLYAGLMIGRDGAPRVVEFNCRFGDPETQTILPLLKPGLLGALHRVARGESPGPLERLPGHTVTTVLASRGYPESPEKGAAITIPADLDRNVSVFHAGTTRGDDGVLRVAGGRVLNVTGTGATLQEAQRRSREAAERITFATRIFRRDIGWREMART